MRFILFSDLVKGTIAPLMQVKRRSAGFPSPARRHRRDISARRHLPAFITPAILE
jgi:hypothetical protein